MSLWVCQDCKALTGGSGGELRWWEMYEEMR